MREYLKPEIILNTYKATAIMNGSDVDINIGDEGATDDIPEQNT